MEDGERARTGIKSLKVRLQPRRSATTSRSRSRTCTRCRRDYHPQADDRRRRALHHAGAEGIRREGARRRRADRRRASSSCSRRCGSAWRPKRRACSIPRARWPASTCSAALAETATVCNYTKPHVHDGDEIVARSTCAIPVVERLAGGAFVPERHPAQRDHAPARDPHRARTWAASRPTCGRWRCSACWRRPDRSCRRARPRSGWSIASTRASARRTTSRAANRRSWSRCRRPRTS